MVHFDVSASDRTWAELLAEFVRRSVGGLSTEGRFVLVIELMRLLKPEIDELNRREQDQAKAGEG